MICPIANIYVLFFQQLQHMQRHYPSYCSLWNTNSRYSTLCLLSHSACTFIRATVSFQMKTSACSLTGQTLTLSSLVRVWPGLEYIQCSLVPRSRLTAPAATGYLGELHPFLAEAAQLHKCSPAGTMRVHSRLLGHLRLDQSYSLLSGRSASVVLEFFKALDIRGEMALDGENRCSCML